MANKTSIWMPLYIGDYLADTAHLNAEQSGAYLHLLMHYWRKGPLSTDLDALVSVAKLRGTNAPSIIQALLAEFFTLADDGLWHHGRQDAEISKAQNKSLRAQEKAREAATARWSQRAQGDSPSNAPSNAPSIPQAMLEQCPLPSPLPKEQKQKHSAKDKLSPDVREIYLAYPRHKEPHAAYKAIEKALTIKTKDELLAAVVAFRAHVERKGTEPDYIPYPAKWFNAGSYDEENESIKPKVLWTDVEGNPIQ